MSTTYGRLFLSPDRTKWTLSDLAPHVTIRMKQLFPRICKTQVKDFEFKNDLAHCNDLLWFSSRYPLSITAADLKVLKKGRKGYEDRVAKLEQIFTPEYVPPPVKGLKPACDLRHFQMQAAVLAHEVRALLLGDDVGLGKTVSTILWLLMPGTLPGLVVVESHLQQQWKEKIEEFSELSAHIITTGKPYELPPSDTYIISYGKLAGWVDLISKRFFKSACWDEIQGLRRGTDSVKGKASKVLADHVDYRLGLSATPVHNYGIEIFNIFEILSPGVLGNRIEFKREWCIDARQAESEDGAGQQIAQDGKMVADPVALGSYLREQRALLRRTKEDVGQQLPPVNTMVEHIGHDEKALKSIEEVARQLALRYDTGGYEEKGKAALALDLLVRQATGLSKARYIAQYVKMFLDNNVPVLLGGWHRAVYDIWLAELAAYKPAMYTGTESPTQKKEQKRRFMEGETNLLIMSVRSGSGLDGLQHRCSVALHGELDWSPKTHKQFTGRLDREGQTNPVLSVFLPSRDGSDPPIIELLGVKTAQADGIMDPGRFFHATESDVSRVRLLVERYLPGKAKHAA